MDPAHALPLTVQSVQARLTTAVVVVIPTFKRNELLIKLLGLIDEHVGELDVPGTADLVARTSVLVIDNDPAGGARSAVTHSGAERTVPIRYVHEPEPGIGAVRARALREAARGSIIVFIDDDEVPGTAWLAPLVRTWEQTGAEVVLGRVLPQYVEPPSPWILAGRFFIRPEHPTGTIVRAGASSNMLVDVDGLARLGVSFDPERGLFGGEDTLLTRQVHALGGRNLWCYEASVHDLVPPTRTTREWVMARRFSHATSSVWIDLHLTRTAAGRRGVRIGATMRGLALVARGGARAGFGRLIRNVRHDALGIRDAARGVGLLAGALGVGYEEYRRT